MNSMRSGCLNKTKRNKDDNNNNIIGMWQQFPLFDEDGGSNLKKRMRSLCFQLMLTMMMMMMGTIGSLDRHADNLSQTDVIMVNSLSLK